MNRASELLSAALVARLEDAESVRLAIPGGSALEALPGVRRRLGDAWQRVALTWVDERCVAVSSPESNRGAAARMGLVDAGVWRADPSGPARALPLYEEGETPAQSLARVSLGWVRDFHEALDVILLGMGADGHVASLFPSRVMPTAGPVAYVVDSPKPPACRITLTRRALATARHVVLVATGEAKREAVRRLVSGDTRLPAHGLEGLVIVTDIQPDWDPAVDPAIRADTKSDANQRGGSDGANGV